MSANAILRKYGLHNTKDLIRAARKEKLPLYIAAAFTQKETGGWNIYGHDKGGTNYGAGAVTAANYAAFVGKVLAGARSNGVGPMQITWPGFFSDAAKKGFKLWKPYDNYRYGFRLIKKYMAAADHNKIVYAGTRYNGSSRYGHEVADLADLWHRRLGKYAGVPKGKSHKRETPLVVDGVIGPKTTRRLQKHRKTPVDGFISGQNSNHRHNFPADNWTTMHFNRAHSGSLLMASIQRWAGVRDDGIGGPDTAYAIQKKLGVKRDRICGPITCKALQRACNDGEI